MDGAARTFKRFGKRILRTRGARAGVIRAAARRGHSLVLVYHRVLRDGTQRSPVVPSVWATELQRHVELLGDIGEVVPLADLLRPPGLTRPVRFAITFDDDYSSHAETALPALRRLGAPATFFLCGRTISGRGMYWWQALEELIAVEGLKGASRAAGVEAVGSEHLASLCEREPALQRRVLAAAPSGDADLLDARGIRAITDAGMTVGFHTLDHPLLPGLTRADVASALHTGRDRLEATAGTQTTLFAYPHGKTEAAVTAAVQRAGYAAAWTGRPAAMRHDDPRFTLGRWEAGPLGTDEFVSSVLRRLLAR